MRRGGKMRIFSETDIEKYLEYTDENILSREELLGQCFICGQKINEVELPEGPEKQVVCLKDRDYFVKTVEELIEMGELELEK